MRTLYYYSLFFLLSNIVTAEIKDIGVIGVVSSSLPKKSVVLLRIKDTVKTLKVGQFFLNHYRVDKIVDRYVVLKDSNGKTHNLMIGAHSIMEDLKIISKEYYSSVLKSYERPATTDRYGFGRNPLPPYKRYEMFEPYYIEDYNYEYDDTDTFPDPYGYRLTGDFLSGIGLLNDDIIVDNNGEDITSYSGILRMLNNDEEINIGYLRKGLYRNLRLLIH